jgi:deoxyribodipyrimidine photo-lyase
MKAIFWFRRDLRLEDNAGLYHALKSGVEILPIFIFDKSILDKLSDKTDPRVSFIYQEIAAIKAQLQELGSDLKVFYGNPSSVFKNIFKSEEINKLYCNYDFESYAIQRDEEIKDLAEAKNIEFLSYKDHVIFDGKEILKDDGNPYVVFTPYKRKWLAKLESRKSKGLSYYLKSYPTEKYFSNFVKQQSEEILSLNSMGFQKSEIGIPGKEVAQRIIKNYDRDRDFPSINGTSRLGIHFRFGTLSLREKARKAQKLNDIYLSELVWRDFYAQILYHFPHVEKNPFRAKYENIEWRNDETDFKNWCEGRTGYPMVDAGMRELNQTRHMHNRVRMVVASFLTKHLLIDWRWGEQYFADKLLDFDLASNNGGWQWAAGCGTDAAPYFRIFNPESQMKKFDKELKYIKKWVPEYGTPEYVEPIVDHKFARERCLKTYKDELSKH